MHSNEETCSTTQVTHPIVTSLNTDEGAAYRVGFKNPRWGFPIEESSELMRLISPLDQTHVFKNKFSNCGANKANVSEVSAEAAGDAVI